MLALYLPKLGIPLADCPICIGGIGNPSMAKITDEMLLFLMTPMEKSKLMEQVADGVAPTAQQTKRKEIALKTPSN